MDGTLTEGHIDFNDMRKRTREWDTGTGPCRTVRLAGTILGGSGGHSSHDRVSIPTTHSSPAGIPQGDLFTVLEASTPDHIRDAMSTILEIEAEAAKLVSMKEGLLELLGLLKEHKVGREGDQRRGREAERTHCRVVGDTSQGCLSVNMNI